MTLLSTIERALAEIPDPEMPISIVDLGLVERITIEDAPDDPSARGARVTIEILPTFVGCPALDMIRRDIERKVGLVAGVGSVIVSFVHDPPWSIDRISETGRSALREHGVTVPERGVSTMPRPGERVTLRASAIECPFCGSNSTVLESPFGPTRCRTIWYCSACKNSFERMKRVAAGG